MAFDYTNLYPDTSGNGGFTKTWNYTTVGDSIAVCSASGYFNKVASRLGIGDNIFVAVVDAFDKTRTTLVDAAILSVIGIAAGIVTTQVFKSGLSNVDNTSDINKPVSTAQAAAIAVAAANAANASNLTSGTVATARLPPSVPVLLNTLTASNSATLSDLTSFTAAYSAYDLVFENIVPATNASTLELQVHSGGSFQATSYLGIHSSIANSNLTPSNNTPTTFIGLSGSNDVANAVPGTSGTMRVYTPSATAAAKAWGGSMYNNSGATSRLGLVSGFWNSAGAIDGFQVLFSAGNITSGVIKIYGIP